MKSNNENRISVLKKHLQPTDQFIEKQVTKDEKKEEKRFLTVTDSKSGKTIQVPIENKTILATEFSKLNLT